MALTDLLPFSFEPWDQAVAAHPGWLIGFRTGEYFEFYDEQAQQVVDIINSERRKKTAADGLKRFEERVYTRKDALGTKRPVAGFHFHQEQPLTVLASKRNLAILDFDEDPAKARKEKREPRRELKVWAR